MTWKYTGPLSLLCLAVVICVLLGLSAYRSYSLGQHRTMYDNPIYRWRISVAVALSELRDPPTRGYTAYGSINDYLIEHGLALTRESPSFDLGEIRKLIYDTDRLETVFHEASSIPIDYSLPSVPIVGNEKGGAVYCYWAFRIFGIHVVSLWYFYFLLLAASALGFVVTFWRSPACMLLLTIYLIGHLYMIDIASTAVFQTVHNSRFLSVLAILPSMHLLLLVLCESQFKLERAIIAAGQTILLFFIIFNRLEAAWQPVAVFVVSAVVILARARDRGPLNPRGLKSITAVGWPIVLVIAGGLGGIAYEHVALDAQSYSTETKTHTFWDPLLVGTISANAELTEEYGLGQPPYSDTMGYFIARKYVMDHNDRASPIAVLQDGKIVGVLAVKNMGVFDQVQRHVFWEMTRRHPWLVLRSVLYDKPLAEIRFVLAEASLYRLAPFAWCALLAFACGFFIRLGAVSTGGHELAPIKGWIVLLVGLLSISTALIFPTPYLPDAILYFVMLLLSPFATLPFCARRIYAASWTVAKR